MYRLVHQIFIAVLDNSVHHHSLVFVIVVVRDNSVLHNWPIFVRQLYCWRATWPSHDHFKQLFGYQIRDREQCREIFLGCLSSIWCLVNSNRRHSDPICILPKGRLQSQQIHIDSYSTHCSFWSHFDYLYTFLRGSILVSQLVGPWRNTVLCSGICRQLRLPCWHVPHRSSHNKQVSSTRISSPSSKLVNKKSSASLQLHLGFYPYLTNTLLCCRQGW